MKQITAIGLGEILWDVLPDGKKLGGAPANFAYHINALGGTGVPVSRIGDDALGMETIAALEGKGVATNYIAVDKEHPTGTVNASVDSHGVATYSFPDNVAWDYLEVRSKTLQLAAIADVICFGTLAQRAATSRKTVLATLAAAPQALKIYDINLRQQFYDADRIRTSLAMADILKINDEELALITDMYSLPKDEKKALELLLCRHDLKVVVLTRGGEGSIVMSAKEVSELAGEETSVVDTIGAGDSFTAAMALAYLQGQSLDEVNRYATRVAAYVCGQAGAMPPMPTELRIK